MNTCRKKTKWGKCQQELEGQAKWCSAHRFWSQAGVTPDPYYEQKVVLGLVTPTWDWMSDTEAHALLNGRLRGDGRRIDQWVAGDPLLIDTEALR